MPVLVTHIDLDGVGCAVLFKLAFPEGTVYLSKSKALDDFVEAVRDYDLYFLELPVSQQLNSLLGVLGRERFVERFTQNASPILTEQEKFLLEVEQERIRRYVEDTKLVQVGTKDGLTYGVVYAEQNINNLADHILGTRSDLDYLAIWNWRGQTVSLRTKKDHVDVSAVARKHGGGGHPKAAGYPLPVLVF